MGTRAHTPGVRAEIEAELLPDLLPVVQRWCAARGMDPRRWLHVPEIAACFQSEAWRRRTARLKAGGMEQSAAERAAARELGLEVSMLRTRQNRAKATAVRAPHRVGAPSGNESDPCDTSQRGSVQHGAGPLVLV